MTSHEQDRSCSAVSDAKRRVFQSHRCLTFRGRSGLIELLGVVLSIQALLIIFFVGVRAIRTNHCGRMDRGVQGIAFWAGIFLLLIVDTLLVLRKVCVR
jgi:hypothetical protein